MHKKRNEKDRKRLKRKIHIRKRLHGTADRPRMTVFRSNQNLFVQVIDDEQGKTLASISTLEKEFSSMKATVKDAEKLGEAMGKRLVENKINTVVFDRNGYLYHGVVKSLADGAANRNRVLGVDMYNQEIMIKTSQEFVEKLVKLNRTAKVVKGGRRFSFSALTVVGDKKGRVGFGFGKANDVSEAIRKSIEKAKKNMVVLPLKNGTIPHKIQAKYKGSSVLLLPACSGTGIIAGGPVRAVLEAAGATDVMSKSLGSNTSVNVVQATFAAIDGLMDARVIAKNRGKLSRMFGGNYG